MLDTVAIGMIRVGPDWGVLEMNATAGRMLRVTPEESMGRSFWELAKALDQASLSMDITAENDTGRVIHLGTGGSLARAAAELEQESEKRRTAERTLELKNEFLQAVLDNVGAGIAACDETGTLRIFNNATRRFHGGPETPIQPDGWSSQYDLYYPDGASLMRKEDLPLYRAFCGEVVRRVEFVIAPKGGPRRTLLANGQPLVAADGTRLGAMVAMQDITHRKLSAMRIRRALRQFRALFNDAPIAYQEIDRYGNISRVNRAGCELLGRSKEELLSKPVWEFVSYHERERTRTAVFEKLSGARPVECIEREYTKGSGKPLMLEIHENLIYDSMGQIAGIRTAMLDTTDRKQREQQAQALAREKYAREQAEAASQEIRSTLERIGDAYIAFDKEWRYTYVNRKAAELALKPASKLIGKCVWDEFPEAVFTPFYSELQRSMREQKPVEFVNHFVPLGKWFENSVYPSPSGVGVFYRDITERVHTQRELERRTNELARKNAELETFAYVASHDLQEPLRMIGGYAGLLGKRYSRVEDADAHDFISYITEGVDRMQRLIRDLLELSRLDESAAAPVGQVSLAEVVDLVCGTFELAIEDTGAIITRTALPVIQFNETHLLQVMQNLIGNAIKYRGDAPPKIAVCAERAHGGWIVHVADNGPGFDMQYAEQIFKPFKRLAARDQSGTGIGLAICKRIAEKRGGRIWAESDPGLGSKFYFTVPDEVPAGD